MSPIHPRSVIRSLVSEVPAFVSERFAFLAVRDIGALRRLKLVMELVVRWRMR
jgi:hypothetical protein